MNNNDKGDEHATLFWRFNINIQRDQEFGYVLENSTSSRSFAHDPLRVLSQTQAHPLQDTLPKIFECIKRLFIRSQLLITIILTILNIQ